MKQIKLIEIEIKNFKGIENFELKETELKQLLSQINALILKINKDVFNFTEWTPEKV